MGWRRARAVISAASASPPLILTSGFAVCLPGVGHGGCRLLAPLDVRRSGAGRLLIEVMPATPQLSLFALPPIIQFPERRFGHAQRRAFSLTPRRSDGVGFRKPLR